VSNLINLIVVNSVEFDYIRLINQILDMLIFHLLLENIFKLNIYSKAIQKFEIMVFEEYIINTTIFDLIID
jgi:hypothetical protein